MPMIRGFDEGTDIKWGNKHDAMTGTIRARCFSSGTVTVDGVNYEVEVAGNSPSYIVETYTGEMRVVSHTAVFAKKMNRHTGVTN